MGGDNYQYDRETAALARAAVRSTSLLGELEAALTLLCSAREKLKQEEDSSDYHRICLQIERLTALVSRRSHSANDRNSATGDLSRPISDAASNARSLQ